MNGGIAMSIKNMRYTRGALSILLAAIPLVVCGQSFDRQTPNADVLSADEWKKVDDSVDRGLVWLASQQRDDGSFPSIESGQPAITSLAVMAFLARGHCPGTQPYGIVLDRAIDFVVAQQQSGGLLYGGSTAMAVTDWNQGSHTANYNHAISCLMLGEVFGMS